MGDIDAEVVGLLAVGRPPDFLEDLAVGDDFAGVAGEEPEEGVLGGGHFDFASLDSDDAGGEVHLKGAGVENCVVGFRLGMAADDAEACEEFGGAEGLGHVVVGAVVEGGDFVTFALLDGEDEDGSAAPFAEAFEDGEAVHGGEAEVEDDDIGVALGGFGQAVLAIGGFEDAVAGGFECDAEEASDLDFVVNNKDRMCGRGGFAHETGSRMVSGLVSGLVSTGR